MGRRVGAVRMLWVRALTGAEGSKSSRVSMASGLEVASDKPEAKTGSFHLFICFKRRKKSGNLRLFLPGR